MPTYEYRCDACAENFDVVQGFHDKPLTSCPTCGSPVRKVFGTVGIVFKGSGFYKTDSRDGARSKSRDGDSKAPAAATADTPSSDTASSDTSSRSSDKGGPDSSGSGGTSSSGSPDANPSATPAGKKAPATKDASSPA